MCRHSRTHTHRCSNTDTHITWIDKQICKQRHNNTCRNTCIYIQDMQTHTQGRYTHTNRHKYIHRHIHIYIRVFDKFWSLGQIGSKMVSVCAGVWKHWADYRTFWPIFTTLVLLPIYFVYSLVSIYQTFTTFIGQCPAWLAVSIPLCVRHWEYILNKLTKS